MTDGDDSVDTKHPSRYALTLATRIPTCLVAVPASRGIIVQLMPRREVMLEMTSTG